MIAVALASGATDPAEGVTSPDATTSTTESRHEVKLSSLFVPNSPNSGLLLKGRINGGPPLRFLLDSGAQQIVLDRRAAARSGIAGGSDFDLVGVGTSAKAAHRTTVRTVTVGDLEFHGCGLIIAEDKLLEGIDGVVPLSLFSDFLLRLDIPRRTLELTPNPSIGQVGGTSTAPMSHSLLFLKAKVNDLQEGYVLLDTGALYDALSERTARALGMPRMLGWAVPVLGGAGEVVGRVYSSAVHFRLGSSVLLATQFVVVSLDELEQRHQIKIAGILGFPSLRNSVLRIDYRKGLVSIANK